MNSESPFDAAEAAEAFYAPLSSAMSPARRVGWESDAAHLLRLRAIADSLTPLDGLRDLRDIGCGEGRLLEVLNEVGYSGTYVGEEILQDMVSRAKAAHPGAEFILGDALGSGPRADAIVCSGTLNTPAGNAHQESAEGALQCLWERTKVVLVLDFAVRDKHAEGAELRTLDLMRMWRCARELTDLVSVREDLISGEALMVLRRSRRPTLERLLPGPAWATERARVLLAAREPEAVRLTLQDHRDDTSALWRALADLVSGRSLDAERALRALTSHPELRGRALLHLGVVLLATHRAEEAKASFIAASQCDSDASDEARVMLVERAQRAGDVNEARRWAASITDPWMRREVTPD
ncbi:MAG: methyltransferase domain-containing protein [Myxococcota bacterium]